MPAPALSIVIPAFNEAGRIGVTMQRSLVYLDQRSLAGEIIVVDDGSSDGTPALVEKQRERDGRIRLLRLPRNRGKGAAVREGVLSSRGARVLFMDADLSTPIEELANLERALDEGADVAIGSRALAQSHILRHQHPVREAMGKIFNLLVRHLGLSEFRDTQCGFKLFTREAADVLFRQATVDRFAFDVEILLLSRGRFRVAEVPVAWQHVDQSKLSMVRDASRMAYDLLRVRLAGRTSRR